MLKTNMNRANYIKHKQIHSANVLQSNYNHHVVCAETLKFMINCI